MRANAPLVFADQQGAIPIMSSRQHVLGLETMSGQLQWM